MLHISLVYFFLSLSSVSLYGYIHLSIHLPFDGGHLICFGFGANTDKSSK